MPEAASPVWWLTGPPCAGKSATAWELFSRVLAGRPRAHLDVDQLGMCYPEPHDDGARAALTAQAAAVVVRHHLAAGADVVVVSGVLDAGADHLVREALGDVPVAFCRVRADEAVLRTRLQQRYDDDAARRALDDARRWDATDLPAVDATGCTVGEAAERAAECFATTRPVHAAGRSAETSREPLGTARAVLLCGPPGVGTSSAGFGLASSSWARGQTCTYLDGHQVSLTAELPRRGASAAGVAGTTAALVGDLWRTYRAAGAEALVVRAAVRTADDVEAFRAALAETPLLVVRLAAGGAALRERVAARARGEGANLAGDALRGLSETEQRGVAEESLSLQAELVRGGVGDVVVDTSALDAAAVVEHLVALDAQRRASTSSNR